MILWANYPNLYMDFSNLTVSSFAVTGGNGGKGGNGGSHVVVVAVVAVCGLGGTV